MSCRYRRWPEAPVADDFFRFGPGSDRCAQNQQVCSVYPVHLRACRRAWPSSWWPACSHATSSASAVLTVPATPVVPSAPDPVIVGAGDIASCDYPTGAKATAAVLDGIPGTVFALGDNTYVNGTPAEFAQCYDPAWGRFKARTTLPVAGNHDYNTPGAAVTTATSAPPPGIRPGATTTPRSARGTSSSFNSTVRPSAGAAPGPPRSSGCGASWPPVRRSARWRCGTSRGSARPRSTGPSALPAVLAGPLRLRRRRRPQRQRSRLRAVRPPDPGR